MNVRQVKEQGLTLLEAENRFAAAVIPMMAKTIPTMYNQRRALATDILLPVRTVKAMLPLPEHKVNLQVQYCRLQHQSNTGSQQC